MKKSILSLILCAMLAGPESVSALTPHAMPRVLPAAVTTTATVKPSPRTLERQTRAERLEQRKARRRVVRPLSRSQRTRTRKPVLTPVEKPATPARIPAADFKREVWTLTNLERIKNGLEPLLYNALLEQSAQNHADDMLRRDYFSHDTPEGLDFSARIRATGYGSLTIDTCQCRSFRVSFGENNAKGQTTPAQVVKEWMASEGHKENILSARFKEIGVGIAGTIWVQNFGTVETTK